jgi:PleD family two-component response regulator
MQEGEKASAAVIVAAGSDLFFLAKIREAAAHLGMEVECARTVESVLDKARERDPEMLTLDLNASRFDPMTLIAAVRGDARFAALPILGFYSHVNGKLRQDALAAGCDKVVPRSEFSAKLPALLAQMRVTQTAR